MTINSSVNERSESGFVISVIARSESDEAISFEIATPPFGRLAMTKG